MTLDCSTILVRIGDFAIMTEQLLIYYQSLTH